MLAQVENAKLQRIMANLQSQYVFKVDWQKGKDHVLADGLSRAPLDPGDNDDDQDDEMYDDNASRTVIAATNIMADEDNEEVPTKKHVDPIVDDLRIAAKNDDDYRALIEEVMRDFAEVEKLAPFVKQFRAN